MTHLCAGGKTSQPEPDTVTLSGYEDDDDISFMESVTDSNDSLPSQLRKRQATDEGKQYLNITPPSRPLGLNPQPVSSTVGCRASSNVNVETSVHGANLSPSEAHPGTEVPTLGAVRSQLRGGVALATGVAPTLLGHPPSDSERRMMWDGVVVPQGMIQQILEHLQPMLSSQGSSQPPPQAIPQPPPPPQPTHQQEHGEWCEHAAKGMHRVPALDAGHLPAPPWAPPHVVPPQFAPMSAQSYNAMPMSHGSFSVGHFGTQMGGQEAMARAELARASQERLENERAARIREVQLRAYYGLPPM